MEIQSYICDAVYGIHDKTRDVGTTYHRGGFVEPLLQCVLAALVIRHATRNAPYCHLWSVRL